MYERASHVLQRLSDALLYCIQQDCDDAWRDVLPEDLLPPLSPFKAAELLERCWQSEWHSQDWHPTCKGGRLLAWLVLVLERCEVC